MDKQSKYGVLVQNESIKESIFKDVVTFSWLTFCIFISQNNTFWTLITGCMFLFWGAVKIKQGLGMGNYFKTKEDLKNWVEQLPDDKVD